VGLVYRQVVTSNAFSVKGVVFNHNKQIFSALEYNDKQRLDTSYIASVGLISKTLVNLGKADFDKEDSLSSACVQRLYEYEERFSMIPKNQNDVKIMSKPQFIEYFDDMEQGHVAKLDKLYIHLLQLLKEISQRSEVEVVKTDELMGQLIMFDKMANSEILKKKEQIIKILLLVYTSSSVPDQKVSKQIWNICLRAISSAKRWKSFQPLFELKDEDRYHNSHSFAKINSMKSELNKEIEACKNEFVEQLNDQKVIA